MSDLDNDEIQATRKLNGLDDELFKEKENGGKENNLKQKI